MFLSLVATCFQDAIHGCGDDRLLDDGARIQQLINENKLYKAMGMFDERLAIENRYAQPSMQNINTVGARIPNKFGIRMVNSCSVLVPTIRKPNLASLDHFIHKERKIFFYKTVQAKVAFFSPFKIRTILFGFRMVKKIKNGRISLDHFIYN